MIKVGDIVCANEKLDKMLASRFVGNKVIVVSIRNGIASINGPDINTNVYSDQIDAIGKSECYYCGGRLDENNRPVFNQSRNRVCCQKCFDENYFVETMDYRVYRRNLGIETDHQGLHHKKYCKEYTCVIEGNKFWCCGPPPKYLADGPVEYKHIVDGDVLPCCGIHYVRKEQMYQIGPEWWVCEQHKKDYEYTCSVTGKVFYSNNPKYLDEKVVSDEGWEKLLNSGKLKKCHWCGMYHHTDVDPALLRSLNKKQITEHVGRNARGILSSAKGICYNCLKGIFPLHYDQIGSIEGVGRTIGIEVECNPTIQSQNALISWTSGEDHLVGGCTDNSLRGDFPAEFRSPILRESNYEVWVDEFCGKLDATVYNRCGLHIHVGTPDFKWADIANLMNYCHRWEDYFFSLVSKSRRLEGAAAEGAGLPRRLPRCFGDFFDTEKDLMMCLYGKDKLTAIEVANRRANDQDGPRYDGAIHRYQWVNFHGHFNKKAIEIRLHHGTTNATKIKNWIALWLCIVDYVVRGGDLSVNPRIVIPVWLRSYYDERARLLAASTRKVVFK